MSRCLISLLFALLTAILCACSESALAAEDGPKAYHATAADMALTTHLAVARLALADLSELPAGVDRETAYVSALNALSALDQQYGCDWARPKLIELYSRPDCPDMHVGWSADGRVGLRIEPLALKNPAFKDWRIYLVSLQSETSLDSIAPTAGQLRFVLRGGQEISSSALSRSHPLWQNLDRLENSFHSPDALPSGASIAFKQIFRLGDLSDRNIESARLSWGLYEITVPWYAVKQ